jgi:hypothetical protein
VYALAYYLRPRLCDDINYRYFFPALTVKIIGAIAVGLVYQFYYNGGDTYNYHTLGSRVIWETIFDDPSAAFRMIVAPPEYPQLYKYTSKVIFYGDPSSMVVVRVAAVLDLLTFSSYAGTAVLFAFVSFVGMWYFFLAFYERWPHLVHRLAICALFVPSVVFWGSGILKDTIVMTCLGVLTYQVKRVLIDKNFSVPGVVAGAACIIMIFLVKIYVLICFLPAALFWIYASTLQTIRPLLLRVMLVPVVLTITIVSGYYAVLKTGENDTRYSLNAIAQTAKITAYDIGFYSGRNAGSGYSLGELDGSFESMVTLFPQAVNVSLFRPYLWEVENPLMLLSALEAIALTLITLLLLVRRPVAFIRSVANPDVMFCMAFSITFAFAVGISTYNFGTLSRYKIPLIPFYLVGLVIIAERSNSARKFEELEETE